MNNHPPLTVQANAQPRTRLRGSAHAFTLTELLVVIGIIVLLTSILLPTVYRMKTAGQKADTANQIGVIRTAIEQYYQTFQAYPGPLEDKQMFGFKGAAPLPAGIGNGQPTMAENLVLGLVGGLENSGGTIRFNGNIIRQGNGVRGLNPSNPKTYNRFIEVTANQLSSGQLAYSADTAIPEFMDRFNDRPRPILYLRARKGMLGIMSNGTANYQYDMRQYVAYPTIYHSPSTSEPQGLLQLGNEDLSEPLRPTAKNPAPALPYFKSPNANLANATNGTGTPRSKDGFILISAGADSIYGTMDDVTSFGSLD